MKNNKKAQSISINTIVIAAIALVVMVLLILIFTNNAGSFNQTVNSCIAQRGTCVDRDSISDECGGQFQTVRYDLACFAGQDPDPDKLCCASIS